MEIFSSVQGAFWEESSCGAWFSGLKFREVLPDFLYQTPPSFSCSSLMSLVEEENQLLSKTDIIFSIFKLRRQN